MYKKGMIKVIDPGCEDDLICSKYMQPGHNHRLYNDDWNPGDIVAYLPHSCDEWVIGGISEIDIMIEDLEKAKMELLTRV